MFIKTIEEMNKIVSENKELSWDGWTVVKSFKSDKAKTSKDGKLINGIWHIQQRFEPTENGWSIPEKIINNA
jgi:hypothetical protein